MQHEAFTVFTVQRVNDLLVLTGTKGNNSQCLGFTAGEDRGAVRTRQNRNFAHDRTNVGTGTTIDTLAGFQDRTANDVFFQILDDRGNFAFKRIGNFITKFLDDVCLGSRNSSRTLLFDNMCISSGQAFGAQRSNFFDQCVVTFRKFCNVTRLFGCFFGQINDQVENALELFVTELHGAKHDVFGQLGCFGFNHHHAIAGTGNNQIQIAFLDRFGRRVEQVFTILVTNAGSTNRAKERQTGNGQGRRGTDHGNHVRIVFHVVRQNGTNDLGVVAVLRVEQRTDRTVDQTRNKGFFFRRAAFTFEEATRDFASGKCFFLVVNRQREKVDIRARLFGANSSTQDNGFTVGNLDGTICLTGDFTGFENQFGIAPLHFLTDDIKHYFLFLLQTSGGPESVHEFRTHYS